MTSPTEGNVKGNRLQLTREEIQALIPRARRLAFVQAVRRAVAEAQAQESEEVAS